ncbi:hypothetical protein NY10_564 [Carnobacterium antarcticum]|nr:hypothetical protein NY10_564 [Carnobacterium sp. CP1]
MKTWKAFFELVIKKLFVLIILQKKDRQENRIKPSVFLPADLPFKLRLTVLRQLTLVKNFSPLFN